MHRRRVRRARRCVGTTLGGDNRAEFEIGKHTVIVRSRKIARARSERGRDDKSLVDLSQ